MTVAAMLGVLEAGCFYTIIDVQMPQQRVQLILDALHPALLLTDAGKVPIWADAAGKLPCVSTEVAASCDIDESLLAARQRDIIDTDLQYVLFTSGSTGHPKGVAIRHRSVLDFVEWAVPALRLDEAARFGNQRRYISTTRCWIFSARSKAAHTSTSCPRGTSCSRHG